MAPAWKYLDKVLQNCCFYMERWSLLNRWMFFRNLSVSRPPLEDVWKKQETNASFVFFIAVFFVYRRVKLLHIPTRDVIIASLTTVLCTSVILGFIFPILQAFPSFCKLSRFCFSYISFFVHEFYSSGTLSSTCNTWADASWTMLKMPVKSSPISNSCVGTYHCSNHFVLKLYASIDATPTCSNIALVISSPRKVNGCSTDTDASNLTVHRLYCLKLQMSRHTWPTHCPFSIVCGPGLVEWPYGTLEDAHSTVFLLYQVV